jgi:hypothetical protein
MKALSLPLTIVIIAIVLLVVALVIMTIFTGQMASIIGFLNPWAQKTVSENLCYDSCASWCRGHIGEKSIEWSELKVDTQGGEKSCDSIMQEAMGDDIGKCTCT